MRSYSLRFRASVEKDLRRLPVKARRRCLERIDRLLAEPRPYAVRQLTGSLHTYRLRVGDYRVVYQIDDERQVVIVDYVRHRRDAYK